MNKKYLKTIGISLGALILTTVAISASDVMQNVSGNLTGLVIDSTGPCAEGSVLVGFGDYAVCIDEYEASASTLCTFSTPTNELQTSQNMDAGNCLPESKESVIPWRFVSMTQAQQLCARAGKRLPTSIEWYKAVSGSTDVSKCAINEKSGQPRETGEMDCVSPSGMHDMIGNVWEWIEGEVHDGVYNDRDLPPNGYVAQVDSTGIALETSSEANNDYGKDYIWTNNEGVRGMIRGGFFGSGDDAGLYTANIAVPLDFRTTGIGFRCVKDVY